VWRVADPIKLAARVNFSIDLKHGLPLGQPLDQIATLLTGLAQQLATQYLAGLDVNSVLAAGVQPLLARLEEGWSARRSWPTWDSKWPMSAWRTSRRRAN
jgi:hypothetical protein